MEAIFRALNEAFESLETRLRWRESENNELRAENAALKERVTELEAKLKEEDDF